MVNEINFEEISKKYEEKLEKILSLSFLDLIERYIDPNNSERQLYEFVLAINPEYTKNRKNLINEINFNKAYRNLKLKTGMIDFNGETIEKRKLLENLVLACKGKEEFFKKHVNESYTKTNLDHYKFAWETYKVPSNLKNIYFQKIQDFDYPNREIIRKLLLNKKKSSQKQRDINQLSLFEE